MEILRVGGRRSGSGRRTDRCIPNNALRATGGNCEDLCGSMFGHVYSHVYCVENKLSMTKCRRGLVARVYD